jgi:hypothetical protein
VAASAFVTRPTVSPVAGFVIVSVSEPTASTAPSTKMPRSRIVVVTAMR